MVCPRREAGLRLLINEASLLRALYDGLRSFTEACLIYDLRIGVER